MSKEGKRRGRRERKKTKEAGGHSLETEDVDGGKGTKREGRKH